MPEYIILAGVNGAGKSTLYRSLLSSDKNYALINADEILQSMHGDLAFESGYPKCQFKLEKC